MHRSAALDAAFTDILLNGTGVLPIWIAPFKAPWLAVHSAEFWLQSHCRTSDMGCAVDSIHFNGTSIISTLPNRWALVQNQLGEYTMTGSFAGGSGTNFPHVSAEVRAVVQAGSPGALLQAIQRTLRGVTPNDPTCAAIAGQDLAYDLSSQPLLRAVFSTWDTSQVQVRVPGQALPHQPIIILPPSQPISHHFLPSLLSWSHSRAYKPTSRVPASTPTASTA
jgi:hypothetical protein